MTLQSRVLRLPRRWLTLPAVLLAACTSGTAPAVLDLSGPRRIASPALAVIDEDVVPPTLYLRAGSGFVALDHELFRSFSIGPGKPVDSVRVGIEAVTRPFYLHTQTSPTPVVLDVKK